MAVILARGRNNHWLDGENAYAVGEGSKLFAKIARPTEPVIQEKKHSAIEPVVRQVSQEQSLVEYGTIEPVARDAPRKDILAEYSPIGPVAYEVPQEWSSIVRSAVETVYDTLQKRFEAFVHDVAQRQLQFEYERAQELAEIKQLLLLSYSSSSVPSAPEESAVEPVDICGLNTKRYIAEKVHDVFAACATAQLKELEIGAVSLASFTNNPHANQAGGIASLGVLGLIKQIPIIGGVVKQIGKYFLFSKDKAIVTAIKYGARDLGEDGINDLVCDIYRHSKDLGYYDSLKSVFFNQLERADAHEAGASLYTQFANSSCIRKTMNFFNEGGVKLSREEQFEHKFVDKIIQRVINWCYNQGQEGQTLNAGECEESVLEYHVNKISAYQMLQEEEHVQLGGDSSIIEGEYYVAAVGA